MGWNKSQLLALLNAYNCIQRCCYGDGEKIYDVFVQIIFPVIQQTSIGRKADPHNLVMASNSALSVM